MRAVTKAIPPLLLDCTGNLDVTLALYPVVKGSYPPAAPGLRNKSARGPGASSVEFQQHESPSFDKKLPHISSS